jgi:O-antigen/teichoic acid export membrane protein
LKREFLINISFLILVNILIKPFYILYIEARVQDTLGPNVYGLYFGIFNIAFILQILTDLGIQNYNSRTIAREAKLLPEYLPKILSTKLILSLFYLVIGLVTAGIFGYLSGSFMIFLMVSINLVLLSMILYLRTNIAATGHYRLDSFISTLDKVFLIIILGILLFHPAFKENFTLFTFIYAQTFAFSIVLLIVLFINFRLAEIIAFKLDLSFSKALLRKSLPFSLVIILMSLYMRMDGFMLERMLDDNAYQAGIYAAAFRVYEAVNMIGYLFAVLLLPMFASLLAKKMELVKLIKSSHNLILSISMTVLVAGWLFKNDIMFWMYPVNADPYYGEILGLLMLSFFAISISYIYGTFLTASGLLKKLNGLLFIGVIINFTLNIILIPDQGAKGAAIATIATQFFVLAGQYLLSIRNLGVAPDNRLLIKRLTYGAFVVLTGWVYMKYQFIGNWLVSFVILVIILVFLALIFKMVNIKDFRKDPLRFSGSE